MWCTQITFQSYYDGNFNIWTISAGGRGLRQLTEGPFDHREPRFSPGGTSIAFSCDLSGSYGIYALDLATGKITTWADTSAEEYEPAWSPDGTQIAYVLGGTSIAATTASGHVRTIATAPADGEIRRRTVRGGHAETIPFTAGVSVTTPSYRKRRRDFDSTTPRPVTGIGSPALAPDGASVAFRALNDIWTMRIGQKPAPLTRDHFWKSDPAWSPDARYLSYSSDRGGTLDIWLRDLGTGQDRQLTNLPDAAAVSGTWSRDGSYLAFLDQAGNLYTVEVATGHVQKIFGPLWEPGKPTWSADGGTLALAALKPSSADYREGRSQILLINRATGAATCVEPIPFQSLGTRGDDGPVWSPDGTTMAFVVGSLLYVMPVSHDGTPAGTPRAITAEVTDAPTWSGDSAGTAAAPRSARTWM